MERKFCTKCGAPLREHAKFCIKCGTPIKDVEAVELPVVDTLKTEPIREKATSNDCVKPESHKQEQVKANAIPQSHNPSIDKNNTVKKSTVKTSKTGSRICKQCGTPLLEGSDRCIQCGSFYSESSPENKTTSNTKQTVQQNQPNTKNNTIYEKTTDTSTTIGMIITGVMAIVIFAVVVFGGQYYNPTNKSKSADSVKTTQQAQKKPEAIHVSAEYLMGVYNKDQKAADKIYRGKDVYVTGTVMYKGNFNNDDKNECFNIYDWRYSGEHYAILVSISKGMTDIINNINVGDNVIVGGKCSGVWKQSSDTYHVVGINATKIDKQ